MGNTCDRCCNRDELKIQLVQTSHESRPENFGKTINQLFFKISKTVQASIQKHGLYQFDTHSAAHPSKSTDNPINQAQNQELIYEGQLRGSTLCGMGHMLTSTGDLYVCTFSMNRPEGKGAVYFANGDYFIGRLSLGGVRHGTMHYENGTVYSGDFKNGLKHGYGEFVYKNGSKYSGCWIEDKEHGDGKLVVAGVWNRGMNVSKTRLCVAEIKEKPTMCVE